MLGPLLAEFDGLDKANVMKFIKGWLESLFQLAGIIRPAQTEFFTSESCERTLPGVALFGQGLDLEGRFR